MQDRTTSSYPIATRDAITGCQGTSLRTIVILIATTLGVRYDCRLKAVINTTPQIGSLFLRFQSK